MEMFMNTLANLGYDGIYGLEAAGGGGGGGELPTDPLFNTVKVGEEPQGITISQTKIQFDDADLAHIQFTAGVDPTPNKVALNFKLPTGTEAQDVSTEVLSITASGTTDEPMAHIGVRGDVKIGEEPQGITISQTKIQFDDTDMAHIQFTPGGDPTPDKLSLNFKLPTGTEAQDVSTEVFSITGLGTSVDPIAKIGIKGDDYVTLSYNPGTIEINMKSAVAIEFKGRPTKGYFGLYLEEDDDGSSLQFVWHKDPTDEAGTVALEIKGLNDGTYMTLSRGKMYVREGKVFPLQGEADTALTGDIVINGSLTIQ
jgi:hypothetical protein